MAVIPVGYAQVNLRFSGPALPSGAEVALGFSQPLIAMTPAEVGDAVNGAIVAGDMGGLFANGADLSSILVKFGPNATGPSAETVGTLMSGGGTAGAANVCILMHKVTGLGGRKGRGRSYWPGIPESQVGPGGSVDGTVATAWTDALETFFSDLDALDLNHVLLHSDATAPTTVTAINIDSAIATQRRRQRR